MLWLAGQSLVNEVGVLDSEVTLEATAIELTGVTGVDGGLRGGGVSARSGPRTLVTESSAVDLAAARQESEISSDSSAASTGRAGSNKTGSGGASSEETKRADLEGAGSETGSEASERAAVELEGGSEGLEVGAGGSAGSGLLSGGAGSEGIGSERGAGTISGSILEEEHEVKGQDTLRTVQCDEAGD